MHAQAVVQTVTTGSPRVLDPLSVAWYDNLMGVTSTTRYVNNMDIVPSFPLGQSLLCGPRSMQVESHAARGHHANMYVSGDIHHASAARTVTTAKFGPSLRPISRRIRVHVQPDCGRA